MTYRRAALVAVIVIALCASCVAGVAKSAPSVGSRITSGTTTNRITSRAPTAMEPAQDPYLFIEQRTAETVYLAGIQRAEDEAQEAAEQAAQELAREKAPDRHESAVSPSPAPVISSSGPHSDAWWHGVAICEQGGRNDPFFGYFSIMDGSAGGLDWGTQVGMANQIIARAGDRAWAAACVAAGYQASPGG